MYVSVEASYLTKDLDTTYIPCNIYVLYVVNTYIIYKYILYSFIRKNVQDRVHFTTSSHNK